MAFCFSMMLGFLGRGLLDSNSTTVERLIPALILAAVAAPAAWLIGTKIGEREDD